MKDKPVSRKKILKELEEIQELDCKYSDGMILGSMCTEPHPFAKEVFCKFLDSNLGDPGLFKGSGKEYMPYILFESFFYL